MTTKIFTIIILIIILIRPLKIILDDPNHFFSGGFEANFPIYKKAYDSSQYVKKENPGIIPDETFEAYVGGAFLHGTNPIMIVHEHPPLGRYIIGLSIFLFDNPGTLILPLLGLSALGLFLISNMIISNSFFALLPVGLFLNEPIALSKLQFTPLLEPIQLAFIVFAIYFFLKGIKKNRTLFWFVLSAIMLGFVISIRFFILGACEATAFSLFLLYKKDTMLIKYFLLTLPLSLIVLILSYTRTIQDGYNILQVFGIQKYIFYYHNSKFLHAMSFWDLFLFNRWHTWWGDMRILHDNDWIILWPIAGLTGLLYTASVIRKKLKLLDAEKVLFFWVLLYSILLSIGTTTTRYFLPFVPFLYILAVSFIFKMIIKYSKKLKLL